MSEVDSESFKSLCAEARDLVKRLEGTSVQRVTLKAGDLKLEIERAFGPAGGAAPAAPFAVSGFAPETRTASGSFAAIGAEQDNRVAVLAPLVGTYYASPSPGAKAFVEVGSTVSLGDTVCIVEAMKLMNEVAAGEGGKVVEIVVEDGERVEFEQVLMYLEPADD